MLVIIYDKSLLLSKFNFSEVCGGNTSEAFQSLLETVSNQTLGTLGDSIIAGFCGDNEGIPQVFIAQFGGTPLQGLGECNSSLPLETTTEDEDTDMTTTDNIIVTMNTVALESAVRDSIIMENGTFSSVLVQVWYQQEIELNLITIYLHILESNVWNMNEYYMNTHTHTHSHSHMCTQKHNRLKRICSQEQ